MDSLDFPEINRSALIITFKQPYLDWVNSLPDETSIKIEFAPTLEELNSEPTTYLIPEIFDDIDLEAFIERTWILIFETQLADWYSDEKHWPKKRTMKMFKEWFDLKCSSMVIDLWSKEPLDYSD